MPSRSRSTCLDNVALLQPVTKGVFAVALRRRDSRRGPAGVCPGAMPASRARRPSSSRTTCSSKPTISACRRRRCPPLPFDEAAVRLGPCTAAPTAGCASASTPAWAAWTSAGSLVAGRPSCCRRRSPPASPARASSPRCHPLAVGWGYGPQGTRTAEYAFQDVDLVLAIGVRYSEVSTGVLLDPATPRMSSTSTPTRTTWAGSLKTDVCVHADAGLFLDRVLGQRRRRRAGRRDAALRRPHPPSGRPRMPANTPSRLRPLRRRSDGRSSWPCAGDLPRTRCSSWT